MRMDNPVHAGPGVDIRALATSCCQPIVAGKPFGFFYGLHNRPLLGASGRSGPSSFVVSVLVCCEDRAGTLGLRFRVHRLDRECFYDFLISVHAIPVTSWVG